MSVRKFIASELIRNHCPTLFGIGVRRKMESMFETVRNLQYFITILHFRSISTPVPGTKHHHLALLDGCENVVIFQNYAQLYQADSISGDELNIKILLIILRQRNNNSFSKT